MSIIWIIVSLALLTVGAEALVRGAAGFARRTGLSSFFIGLTIVGFGTSTPELLSSITAALRDSDAIAVGNVVGSNIFNIGVILGVSALIYPISVQVRLVRREVLIVIAVAVVPAAAWLTSRGVERWEGAVMLALLGVYLWRGYALATRENVEVARRVEQEVADAALLNAGRAVMDRLIVQLLSVAVGLGVLMLGAGLLVTHAVTLAQSLGVSELAIGLTLVAGGTSLPELATSIVAAVRKQSDIAVGNVLGSNVFNVLGVLGATALVKPQTIQTQTIVLDLTVMAALSIACLPIMLSQARISRTEGALLTAGYIGYVLILFSAAPGWFEQ